MAKIITSLHYYSKRILTITAILLLAACNSDETKLQGYFEGDYAYIASAVAGNLTKRFVDHGDQVVVNQPLFVLDPEPETNKLAQANSQLTQATQQLLDLQKGARATIIENIQADLNQAQAGLDFAQKTFKRYQVLSQTAAIDKSSLDQAKADYEEKLQAVKSVAAKLAEANLGARENQINAQKAAVAAAAAIVKQAEWSLLQKSIRSPATAQIFNTLYEQGEFVGAGQPVIVLLLSQNNKIVFFVPAKILSMIKVGDQVVFDCDNCKNSYQATINFISPSAEFTPPVIFSQESRDKLVYRVEANPTAAVAKKFHPGQPVDVMIKTK